jgi:hypothetical protein
MKAQFSLVGWDSRHPHAAFLGHADTRTTSVYARITPDTWQEAAHALGQIFDEVLASHGPDANA